MLVFESFGMFKQTGLKFWQSNPEFATLFPALFTQSVSNYYGNIHWNDHNLYYGGFSYC